MTCSDQRSCSIIQQWNSFHFGYCSRRGDEDKLTVVFAHDRFTKMVIAIPTRAKGGKYVSYLATELGRFVVQTGHNPVTLRTDNEPSILRVLEATCMVQLRPQ